LNYVRAFAAAAVEFADSPAIIDGTRVFTYSRMMQAVAVLAGRLRHRQVERGDRLIVFAGNRAEHILLQLACAQIGAVFSPVHPAFRVREAAYVLKSSTPRIAFVDADTAPVLAEAVAASGIQPEVISFDSPQDLKLQDLLDADPSPAEAAVEDVDPQTPLQIVYTSGTTSTPKPVLRSHSAELWSVQTYQKGWNFEAGDRVLVTLTLAWSYGLTLMSMPTLLAGGTVYIERTFHPSRALARIQEHRITTFAGTMSMYGMLLDVLEDHSFDTGSLKKMCLGGEPRNEARVASAEAKFGIRFSEAYALSECFPLLASCPKHDLDLPVGSLGRRITPDAHIKLVDAQGVEVPRGEVGHALINSPGRMIGYLNEPQQTVERLTPDGWVRTGDLLREDDKGYFVFVGRLTDLIIRGGTNISPLEIETALAEHPGVEDAVVLGVPDPDKGERIVALTVLKGGASESEASLLGYLEIALARYKVPQTVLILERIPVGRSGKIVRKELRDWVIQRGS
jgi:long-chain acyl-CoA synthetase